MKRFLLAMAVAVPAVALAAASSDSDTEVATAAINELGLDLFRQIATAQASQNLLLSPYSIQNALAMTYAGAEGETRTEMARVLHFPAADPPLADAFQVLRSEIESSVVTAAKLAAVRAGEGGKVDALEFHLANRLFAQTGYQFLAPFLATAHDQYDAPLQMFDFKTAAEPARATINAWVADQTRDKIRDLLPAGAINPDTRLVLVNALYLKAPWETPFKSADTEDQVFRVRGTDATKVPMMNAKESLGYARRDGYTAVTLPYFGGELQFLILLPDEPTEAAAPAVTPTAQLLRDCAQLETREVELTLPKFRLEPPTLALSKALQAMGMKRAFDVPRRSADFSRMAPPQENSYLYLSEVFHKTFLALDEEGTEAAAATAVVMMRATAIRMQPEPVKVVVDRPFFFAIQHRASGACLFLGQVTDPR